MRPVSKCLALWRNLTRRARVERELDDEVRAVHEMLADEQVQAGLTPVAARRAATLELGGAEQVKERVREVRTGVLVDSLLRDLRFAMRAMARNPGFAAVAIGALALGIGANTAVFSAVHAILLQPLPYQDADRLVMVWEDASAISFPRNTPAPGNYTDWRRQNRSFVDMAATAGVTRNLTVDGPPEQVLGRWVTGNFFSVLGVRPLLGRTLTEEDDAAGAPVVVISYRLWQRRYAGDLDIVGRSITMSGASQTIVGVMPRNFTFRNREMDFWGPIHFTPAQAANRNNHLLNVVARLRPDVSFDQARADMSAIAKRQAVQYPESNSGLGGAVVVPVVEDALGDTRIELLVLTGAAVGVLLIACANLAGVLMSRGLSRRGELAIRGALGATRARLVQQMVVEAMLLALIGGSLGLAIAPAGTAVLADLVPRSLPELNTSIVNGPLLAFTAAVSIATALVFSLPPALYASGTSLQHSLQDAGRASVSGRSRFTRDALVVAQVAMALVLLVGAGLMLRTLANLRAIDIGFRSQRLLTMQVAISRQKYADQARRLAFYNRVLDGVRAVPGVEGAAFASPLPFLSQGNTAGYQIAGQPPERGRDALLRVATSGYLETLGVRLVEGRFFDAGDAADAPKVIVINETMARRHWPAESALGHRLVFRADSVFTIVGVVKDVRERGYLLEMKPGVYLPFAQGGTDWPLPDSLAVRVSGAPLAPVAAIRRIVAQVDPEQPVAAVRTMDEIVGLDVADRQQQLTLLGAFAALALLLAAFGLYGVLSYAVTQRRREIGLRIALGAGMGSVIRLVVTRGLGLTVAGLAVGLLLAVGSTRLMESLLYGVRATDTRTFGGVVVLLVLVAVAACSLPALRATRVDPMRVLRQE